MRGKLVAGNWKMHGSLSENATLLDAIRLGVRGVDVAVCVPFPYLGQARDALSGTRVAWGAQNLSEFGKGAYTGEVSAAMLRDFGCRYVIVGHSERRTIYGEDSATVARKYRGALDVELTPILCVGETLAERESGVTEQVVVAQLDAVISLVGPAGIARGVIAYEPVWAIGTGRNATPEQAQAVHVFIRQRIAAQDAAIAEKLPILYGGSVKAANAVSLLAMADIDGGLIGGASLVADEFLGICNAAAAALGVEAADA